MRADSMEIALNYDLLTIISICWRNMHELFKIDIDPWLAWQQLFKITHYNCMN